MNFEPITIRGRQITAEVLEEIRQNIELNWNKGRSAISTQRDGLPRPVTAP